MNCEKCHQPLEKSSKFCVHCGERVSTSKDTSMKMERNAAKESVADAQSKSAATAYSEPSASSPTDSTRKAKEIGLKYWDFIKSGLRAPYQFAKQIKQADFINGIITLILFSIFLAISFYFIIKYFLTVTSAFGALMGQESPSVSFISIFFKGFFYSAIFLAVTGLISFGAIKLMRSAVTLKDFTARYGAILIIPLLLTGIGMLVSMADSIGLVTLFLGLGSVAYSISIPLLISSFKNENSQSLDVFYSAILTFVAIDLVFYLFAKHQIINFIMELTQSFRY